jgi:tetratricopeptide (TPR) repeat protein
MTTSQIIVYLTIAGIATLISVISTYLSLRKDRVNRAQTIVNTILEGIRKPEFYRARSENYNELGRDRIQAWEEGTNRNGEWDWQPLGQAIEYYIDAITYDPNSQHPWTNLAYTYYVIGEKQKALECLQKAFELAEPGPNHPGHHYKQVETAINSNTGLYGGPINRPPMPDWFRKKYAQFLD